MTLEPDDAQPGMTRLILYGHHANSVSWLEVDKPGEPTDPALVN